MGVSAPSAGSVQALANEWLVSFVGMESAPCRNMSGANDLRQRSFEYACRIMDFCLKLSTRGSIQRRLADQLFDAGTSIGANLEEATAGQTKPDFIAKNVISLKEAREAVFWLRLVVNRLPAFAGEAMPLLHEANELVAILTTIVKRARSTPGRGNAR